MGDSLKVIRNHEYARSLQRRGVFSRLIHECEAVKVLCTELDAGKTCGSLEIGDSPVLHFVVDGNPEFRASGQSTDLKPGDSVVFSDAEQYEISSPSTTRAVILSVVLEVPGCGDPDRARREDVSTEATTVSSTGFRQ